MRWLPSKCGSLLVWVLVAAPGCTSEEAPDPPVGDDDSAEPGSGGDACGHWEAWGLFGILVTDEGGSFYGILYDDPSLLLLDVLIEQGDCLFLGRDPIPHCEPTCDPPQVCGSGDVCLGWPQGVDLGTIELSGTDPPLTLQAGFGNAYYSDATYPGLVGPGDEVTMHVAGGAAVEPLALRVHGVTRWGEPPEPLTMVRGEDLTIDWLPAAQPTGSRVAVYIGADHHAGVSAYATCVVDDSQGTVTVPAAIVDALIEAGTGGLGVYVENARLLRVDTASAATAAGCVMLHVSTEVLLDLTVEVPAAVGPSSAPSRRAVARPLALGAPG